MTTKGYCLCKFVNYELEGDVGDAVRCYCRTCQCATGTAFATVALVDSSRFRLVSGQELIASFESSPGKRRYFCSNCASPLFTKLDADPATYRIRVGGLENPPGVKIKAHIFVAEKVSWYQIADDLPQFEAWP